MNKRAISLTLLLLGLFLLLGKAYADDFETLKRKISSNNRWFEKLDSQYENLAKRCPAGKRPEMVESELERLRQSMTSLLVENRRLITEVKNGVPPEVLAQDPGKTPSPALKGYDWAKMSPAEKEAYIFSAVGALEKEGAYIGKPSYYYLDAVEAYLKNHSSALQENLDFIFVVNVYEAEPQTRQIIHHLVSPGDF